MENESHELIILTPTDEGFRKVYSERVLGLLRETYKNVPGGCFETEETIMGEGIYWRLHFTLFTKELICCTLWKEHKCGKKIFAIDHNGTPRGKYFSKLERTLLLSLKDEHYFSEASNGIERLLQREGFTPLSNEVAEKILFDKEIIKDNDGFSYQRVLGGKLKSKLMFGHPKLN